MLTMATPTRRSRASHIWERDEHDWYVEPEWCSRRLFQVEPFNGVIWDPACGSGRITAAARSAGYAVHESDLIDRGCGYRLDFLNSGARTDNIVSNPPFRHAEKFVARALELANRKVAMLLPSIWVQGDKRSRWLETTPLVRVLFITPRPSMPPGAALAAGASASGGTTDFAWFVFDRSRWGGPRLGWLRRDA